MPAPLLQLLDHLHRPKYAVADHRNPRSIGRKTPDVVQKRPLLISRAVALLRAHPAPSYGDGPPPISQTHHKSSRCSKPTLLPSTIRRTSPPWEARSNRQRAMGSYQTLTLTAALSNRRLKRRVAEGRVAFVVGILFAILLK